MNLCFVFLSRSRLRISGVAVSDVLTFDPSASNPHSMISAYQVNREFLHQHEIVVDEHGHNITGALSTWIGFAKQTMLKTIKDKCKGWSFPGPSAHETMVQEKWRVKRKMAVIQIWICLLVPAVFSILLHFLGLWTGDIAPSSYFIFKVENESHNLLAFFSLKLLTLIVMFLNEKVK